MAAMLIRRLLGGGVSAPLPSLRALGEAYAVCQNCPASSAAGPARGFSTDGKPPASGHGGDSATPSSEGGVDGGRKGGSVGNPTRPATAAGASFSPPPLTSVVATRRTPDERGRV